MEINLIYEGNNKLFQLSKDVTLSYIKELGKTNFNINNGTICLFYNNESLNKYGDNVTINKIIPYNINKINLYIQLEGYSSKDTNESSMYTNKKRNNVFIDLLKNKFDKFNFEYSNIFESISSFQNKFMIKSNSLIDLIKYFQNKLILIDNIFNDFYQLENYTNLVNFFKLDKNNNNIKDYDVTKITQELDNSISQSYYVKSRYEFEVNIMDYFTKKIKKFMKIQKLIQNIEDSKRNYNEVLIYLEEIYSILLFSKKNNFKNNTNQIKINSSNNTKNNVKKNIIYKLNNNLPKIEKLDDSIDEIKKNKSLNNKNEISKVRAITEIYKSKKIVPNLKLNINLERHKKNNSLNEEMIHPKICKTEFNQFNHIYKSFRDKTEKKMNNIFSDNIIYNKNNFNNQKKLIKNPIEIPKFKKILNDKSSFRKDNTLLNDKKIMLKKENIKSLPFENALLSFKKDNKRTYYHNDENDILDNSFEDSEDFFNNYSNNHNQNNKPISHNIKNKNEKIYSNINHIFKHQIYNNKKDKKKNNSCLEIKNKSKKINEEIETKHEKLNKKIKSNSDDEGNNILNKQIYFSEPNSEKINKKINICQNEEKINNIKKNNEKANEYINNRKSKFETKNKSINKINTESMIEKENELIKNIDKEKELHKNNKTDKNKEILLNLNINKKEQNKKNANILFNDKKEDEKINKLIKINEQTTEIKDKKKKSLSIDEKKNKLNDTNTIKNTISRNSQSNNPINSYYKNTIEDIKSEKKNSLLSEKSKDNFENDFPIRIPRRQITRLTGVRLHPICLNNKDKSNELNSSNDSINDNIHGIIVEKMNGSFNDTNNVTEEEKINIQQLTNKLLPTKKSIFNRQSLFKHQFIPYEPTPLDEKKKKKKNLVGNKFDFII